MKVVTLQLIDLFSDGYNCGSLLVNQLSSRCPKYVFYMLEN